MTRTYITAADGTLYEAVTPRQQTRRKIIRRTLAGIALIIAALFTSAAVIGLSQATTAPRIEEDMPGWDCATMGNRECGMTPTASATKAINIRAAKAACMRAPRKAMQDCLALYLRGAWFDANNFTPAGPVLVRECISQYRGAELADCFTQEIG